MLNEISSLLLTIAGASASFVAILGGFIASKLISLNSERNMIQSRLKQLQYEKSLKTEERDMLRRALDEEDAICYIHNHMADLVSGLPLEDIYEENELQQIDLETLLPYWEKVQIYMDLFDEHIQKNPHDLNSDYIPNELAEEHTDDIFIYEFLKMYAGWCASDYFDNCEPMSRLEWCNNAKEQAMQANMQAAALDIQVQVCQTDLDRLKQPTGIKLGLMIFTLFSVCNIIVPLFLSAIPLSVKWCTIVLYCSIGFLTLGLGATFWYLARMLKWKEPEI